jgi:hypothetical protein
VGANAFSASDGVIQIITNAQVMPNSNGWFSNTKLRELTVAVDSNATLSYSNKNSAYKIIIASHLSNMGDEFNYIPADTLKRIGDNYISVKDDIGREIYQFNMGQYLITTGTSGVTIQACYITDFKDDYEIPATLDDRPVTGIGKFVYMNKSFGNNRVIFPTTVESVGFKAFYNASVGGKLILDGVTEIAGYAFGGINITSVEAPKLKTLAKYGFERCPELKMASITAIQTMNEGAFSACPALEVVRFGTTPTLSYYRMFTYGITIIFEKIITNPNQINDYFNRLDCMGAPLNTFTILVPYQSVEHYQAKLTGCTVKPYGYIHVQSDNNETHIFVLDECHDGYEIVTAISDSTQMNIVDSVNGKNITGIKKDALKPCTSLNTITLPKYYARHEELSLSSAIALQTINVHPENEYFKSVDGVLYSIDGKELVCYPRNKVSSSFETLSTTNIIREYAFYGNSNLKDVVIGNNIIAIGTNAFDMTKLTSVEFKSSTPAYVLGSQVFNTLNEDLIIYVPSGSLNNYKKIGAYQSFTIVEK